jgi:predicted ATPase
VIRELYLHNFKCFATERLELGALTLLSGLNGMGKSSVMHAFLLLRQSQQQGLLHDTGLALNGDLVRLGTAQDVFFEHATEDYERIAIGLTLEDGTRQDWPFDYSPADDVVRLAAQGHSDPAAAIYRTALFSDDFHYLQAERLGPRWCASTARSGRAANTRRPFSPSSAPGTSPTRCCATRGRRPTTSRIRSRHGWAKSRRGRA